MTTRVGAGRSVHNESPFAVRGVIEGFYGAPYTFPERRDLIRFLGRNNFNLYLYAPKNDRQHRMRWWEPYPKSVMHDFGETIRLAKSVGVEFCYAISFGVPMNFATPDDLSVVQDKLGLFYDLGCRSFGILWDDLTQESAHEMSRQAFPDTAHVHSDCSNLLYRWIESLDEACTLYLCPAEYHGSPPFTSYLHHLGEALHPEIRVFYTGPEVCSSSITLDQARTFGEVIRRKPLIWDNYPVNDLLSRNELHLGPLVGRDPGLASETAGFVANVMTQAEASKIPLTTIAKYLKDPQGYVPQRAWMDALDRASGRGDGQSLYRLAENSLASCLQPEQAPRLAALVIEARAAHQSVDVARQAQAFKTLTTYLDVLDESCYFLKNRMANLRLRDDLLPWIEVLESKIWLARHAIHALVAFETQQEYGPSIQSTVEILLEIEREPKSIGGLEIVRFAREVVHRVTGAGTLLPAVLEETRQLSIRDPVEDTPATIVDQEDLIA